MSSMVIFEKNILLLKIKIFKCSNNFLTIIQRKITFVSFNIRPKL